VCSVMHSLTAARERFGASASETSFLCFLGLPNLTRSFTGGFGSGFSSSSCNDDILVVCLGQVHLLNCFWAVIFVVSRIYGEERMLGLTSHLAFVHLQSLMSACVSCNSCSCNIHEAPEDFENTPKSRRPPAIDQPCSPLPALALPLVLALRLQALRGHHLGSLPAQELWGLPPSLVQGTELLQSATEVCRASAQQQRNVKKRRNLLRLPGHCRDLGCNAFRLILCLLPCLAYRRHITAHAALMPMQAASSRMCTAQRLLYRLKVPLGEVWPAHLQGGR